MHVTELMALIVVFFSTLLFRTPVAFLITLAVLHQFFTFNLLWFPALFLMHSLVASLRFDWQFFQDRKRLNLSLVTNKLFQVVQFSVSFSACWFFYDLLQPFLEVSSFLSSFQLMVIFYAIYNAGSLLLVFPFLVLGCWLPVLRSEEDKKSGSQKIINNDYRGHCFSIHLSLFLLRQEFKKYTTTVHTVFKLSRESDFAEEKVNQRFVRYQGMLVRVGDELKELCFSIGKQRSYRWQVKEVMSYYKIVNQLELLVDDLGLVAATLRKKNVDEEYQKECRYWLGLQLKLFESFFNQTLGVAEEDPDKVKANMEKAYDVLDRFFNEKKNIPSTNLTSKTVYRITESIGSLAL